MTQTRIIKKYANRRLYDTFEKRYITLQDVKTLVLEYQDFTIVDAKTKTDLTDQTLLQIITEEENHQIPFFTRALLQNIIRIYGHNVQNLMQQTLERMMAWLSDPSALKMKTSPEPPNPLELMQQMAKSHMAFWQDFLNQNKHK